MGHPNLFGRLSAQRLIVESKSDTAAAKLKEIVKSSTSGHAATHAFYALQGLGAVDAETTKIALASANRGLRRAAIFHGVSSDIGSGIISAADPRELAETFIALTRLAPSEEIGKSLHATLLASKKTVLADPILADAWQATARHHAAGVILASLSDPSNAISAAPVNLIPNADFSDPNLGAWSLRSYKVERPDTIDISIAPGGKEGGNALKISSPFVADAGLGMTITVKPNTAYRLGGMVRTEKFENRGGKGAMINVHDLGSTEGVSGTRGLAVYTRTCIACHGPDGKGVPGAFPPLDGTSWVTGDPSVPARIILGGLQGPIEVLGQKYNNIMPPHTDLNDQEIADVITYVRQSWSNDATPVSAESIKQVRAKYATRTTPWTAAELK